MTLQFVVEVRDIRKGDQLALGPELLSTVGHVEEPSIFGGNGVRLWFEPVTWYDEELGITESSVGDVELDPRAQLVVYRPA